VCSRMRARTRDSRTRLQGLEGTGLSGKQPNVRVLDLAMCSTYKRLLREGQSVEKGPFALHFCTAKP